MKKVHWTSLIECNYQPNSRKKSPMNSLNSSISSHQKGQHLALQDRVIIQVLRSQGQFLRQVAASPNCSPTTVKYKLERGQISCYHGKRYRYDAQAAQRRYQIRRLNCDRKQAFLAKTRFIKYVETHFFKQGCSLDACAGRALASGANSATGSST